MIDDEKYSSLYMILELAEKGEIMKYNFDKNWFTINNKKT